MMYDGKRFTLGVLKQVIAEFEKRYPYEDMDIELRVGQIDCVLKGIEYSCIAKHGDDGIETDKKTLKFDMLATRSLS